MKIVPQSFELINVPDQRHVLQVLEYIKRVCYKSEAKITDQSCVKAVQDLIDMHHDAMLEHESLTFKLSTDRGVSHELVRHRLASFAQESTRYCNYSKDKFGKQLTFVCPVWLDVPTGEIVNVAGDWYLDGKEVVFDQATECWLTAMLQGESKYFQLLALGWVAQQARDVLPNSVKTEVVCTMNFRELRHFFKLRALGTTGKPHPQMQDGAIAILQETQPLVPVVFDDLHWDHTIPIKTKYRGQVILGGQEGRYVL